MNTSPLALLFEANPQEEILASAGIVDIRPLKKGKKPRKMKGWKKRKILAKKARKKNSR